MKVVRDQISEALHPEEEWRLFVESVRDYAIFLLDPEGNVATWNQGAEAIQGYTAEEILGRHLSTLHPPEEVAAGRPARELELARTEGRVEDEGWRVRKDGSRFWANVVTTALRDARGNLHGFAKITRDLSARRAAEEALRRSEERFRLLVETVTDYAIFMLDPEGRVMTWNLGAQKIKGYSAEDIIGQHFSVFYPAADLAAKKPERELETALRDGRLEDEGIRLRKGGAPFLANVVITALWDDHGNLRGFAKITRDLTKQRAAEDELRRSEERFRLLVEAVTDYAIYMIDPDGNVTTWNPGAEKLKAYTSEEIIGKNFSVFFQEEDVRAGAPQEELSLALSQGRFEREGYRVRKDGSRFWASVVLTPIRDATGRLHGYAKVTRDLTSRIEAEQTARELVRAQTARAAAEAAQTRIRESAKLAENAAARAREANRVKDEFLATVSHELRTPLNAIVGWSSLLRTRNQDPALAKGLDVIHRNALAQGKIIEDILDVSRIITGKLRLDLRSANLVAIVNDAIEVVGPSAVARDISIEFTHSQPEYTLVADPERLQQVAWNLLSNAVKFSLAGGRIQVSLETEGAAYVLSVRDAGIGIDPDFLPSVFDRFKQADGSTTRRVGGLGLGLAIVRHLVELHGGEVQALSAGRGQGSTFVIRLPIRTSAPTSVPGSSPPARITSEPDSPSLGLPLVGTRVLVIDDDDDARELAFMVLAEAGARVEAAGSAAEGFAALKRFRPHVLVSDIGMPEEDGYQLMQRVQALDPAEGGGVPSIALTAYTRSEDKNKALAMGFTTHLGKPIHPGDLVAAVSNLAAFIHR